MIGSLKRFKLMLDTKMVKMNSGLSKPTAEVKSANRATSATGSNISSHDLEMSKRRRLVGAIINRKKSEKGIILEAKN